jgi:hypothetical protein
MHALSLSQRVLYDDLAHKSREEITCREHRLSLGLGPMPSDLFPQDNIEPPFP